MLLNRGLIAVAISVAIPICSATEKLTRDGFSAFEFPASAMNYEGAVNISANAVQNPRSKIGDMSNQKHLILFAKVKRMMLGARQLCDVGSYYCLGFGCTTLSHSCCSLGHVCASGYACCGLGCSPIGAECCLSGTYCTAGLHCYLVNGIQRCCSNSLCNDDRGGGTATSVSRVSTTAVPTTPTTRSTSPLSTSASITASAVTVTVPTSTFSPSSSISSKSSLSPNPGPSPATSTTSPSPSTSSKSGLTPASGSSSGSTAPSSTSQLTSTRSSTSTTPRSTTSSVNTNLGRVASGSAVKSGPTEYPWAMGLLWGLWCWG